MLSDVGFSDKAAAGPKPKANYRLEQAWGRGDIKMHQASFLLDIVLSYTNGETHRTSR